MERATEGLSPWPCLQPGSLSQKQMDLFEKPSSGGIVLQKEVISPGKRYETSTGDPGRNLTARIDTGTNRSSRACMTSVGTCTRGSNSLTSKLFTTSK